MKRRAVSPTERQHRRWRCEAPVCAFEMSRLGIALLGPAIGKARAKRERLRPKDNDGPVGKRAQRAGNGMQALLPALQPFIMKNGIHGRRRGSRFSPS